MIMIQYLLSGVIFGFSAGFSPGPLLTLVISETLSYNLKQGLKVAIAPLITDFPIVLIAILLLAKLSHTNLILGIISILGGLLVFYMGYTSFKTKNVKIDMKAKPQSLKKGIIVNFLSPHPYLFWLTVGAPTVIKAMDYSLLSASGFIVFFYFLLVGSKVLLAILISKSKTFLSGKTYLIIMKILGILLFVFAILLFKDGLKLLGLF